MQESLFVHPYFKKLKTLNLLRTDFAVMGGGCLFAHGIISEIDDPKSAFSVLGRFSISDISERVPSVNIRTLISRLTNLRI